MVRGRLQKFLNLNSLDKIHIKYNTIVLQAQLASSIFVLIGSLPRCPAVLTIPIQPKLLYTWSHHSQKTVQTSHSMEKKTEAP